jgi:hypothetical protein
MVRVAHDRAVIRAVVIHVSNEQPLLADLFDLPSSDDAGMLCTNLRSMDGKRPVFVDSMESTFFFPYRVIRFLEIPPGAIERHRAEAGLPDFVLRGADDSFVGEPGSRLPSVVVTDSVAEPDDGSDLELEIDEDFLRRIREA